MVIVHVAVVEFRINTGYGNNIILVVLRHVGDIMEFTNREQQELGGADVW